MRLRLEVRGQKSEVRRSHLVLAVLLTFDLSLLTFAACSASQPRYLSIATGGTGGVYYPYGGALARLISEKIPNTQATAEVTGASVDNLKLIQLGKVDLAFTLADTLAEAVKGEGPFKTTGAVGSVRTLLGISTGATSSPCLSNSRASLATQMTADAPGAGEK